MASPLITIGTYGVIEGIGNVGYCSSGTQFIVLGLASDISTLGAFFNLAASSGHSSLPQI